MVDWRDELHISPYKNLIAYYLIAYYLIRIHNSPFTIHHEVPEAQAERDSPFKI